MKNSGYKEGLEPNSGGAIMASKTRCVAERMAAATVCVLLMTIFPCGDIHADMQDGPRDSTGRGDKRSRLPPGPLDSELTKTVREIVAAQVRNSFGSKSPQMKSLPVGTKLTATVDGERYEASTNRRFAAGVLKDGRVILSRFYVKTEGAWQLGAVVVPPGTDLTYENGKCRADFTGGPSTPLRTAAASQDKAARPGMVTITIVSRCRVSIQISMVKSGKGRRPKDSYGVDVRRGDRKVMEVAKGAYDITCIGGGYLRACSRTVSHSETWEFRPARVRSSARKKRILAWDWKTIRDVHTKRAPESEYNKAKAVEYRKPRVACWQFDEGKGSVLHDRSGNSNHGRIKGAKWVKCGKGYALEFDGVDDHVALGANPSFHDSFRTEWTVEMWVKPESTSKGLKILFDKPYSEHRSPSYQASLGIQLDDGGNRDYGVQIHRPVGAGGALEAYGPAGSAVVGQWTHLAATFDLSSITLTLYKNGVQIAQDRTPSDRTAIYSSHKTSAALGCSLNAGSDYFKGTIEEAKIYDKALSQREIKAHYNRFAEKFGLKKTAMSLLHKPGWEEAKEHYWMWRAGETFRRCASVVNRHHSTPQLRSYSLKSYPLANKDRKLYYSEGVGAA